MTFPAKSNIYEVNVTSTLAVYGEFVQGTGNELLLAASSRALGSAARGALEKSAAALGYGARGCAYVVAGGAGAGALAGGGEGAELGGSAGAGGGEGAALGALAAPGGGEGAAPNDPADAALGARDLLSVVEGLDPLAIVAADAEAAALLGRAYRCEIALDAATRVMGRTVVAFRRFEGMLDAPSEKQKAWALLKKMPKLG